ncbi:MAG: GNAT family N-acetyltransferase [Bdellovibrionales bacterium CG10_big_fil_rev_8_21_14_0_10_45_34]|nr:MAG: GNAT family N-acetyltransferase [Bdellovibrionales bacterium CG10_big_fil_rev_8_21_14_0_10_45_34]
MSNYQAACFSTEWILAVKEFTDAQIGNGYFSESKLADIIERSTSNGECASFILLTEDLQVVGVRLTLAPGNWIDTKRSKVSPHLWNVSKSKVGYFQSLFLHPSVQGIGWGSHLSNMSIDVLRSQGAKAIVAHSWVESPQDSSRRYLKRNGFQTVATHKEYWKDVKYECTRDGYPCLCTAEEMIKFI